MLDFSEFSIHQIRSGPDDSGLAKELTDLLARVVAAEGCSAGGDGCSPQHHQLRASSVETAATPPPSLAATPAHRVSGGGRATSPPTGPFANVAKPFCALTNWVGQQVTPSRPAAAPHDHISRTPPPLLVLHSSVPPDSRTPTVAPSHTNPETTNASEEDPYPPLRLDDFNDLDTEDQQRRGESVPSSNLASFAVTSGTQGIQSRQMPQQQHLPPPPVGGRSLVSNHIVLQNHSHHHQTATQPSPSHHLGPIPNFLYTPPRPMQPTLSTTSSAAASAPGISLFGDQSRISSVANPSPNFHNQPNNGTINGSTPATVPRFASIAADLFHNSSRGSGVAHTNNSSSPPYHYPTAFQPHQNVGASATPKASTRGNRLLNDTPMSGVRGGSPTTFTMTYHSPPHPVTNRATLLSSRGGSGLSPSATPFVLPGASSAAATPGNSRCAPAQMSPSHPQTQQAQQVGNMLSTSPVALTLADCRGHMLEAARDQNGCRLLQRILETQPFDTPEVQEILGSLFPHLPALMSDAYGNFLLQKLLEFAPDDVRLSITTSVAPYLAEIAVTQHGTFSVQKLIESVRSSEEAAVIAQGISPAQVPLLLNDGNGAHVVSKMLMCLPAAHRDFLYVGIATHVAETCNHRQGCCAVQRCIEAATRDQFQLVEDAVMRQLFTLLLDPYGNYVVSRLLERGGTLFQPINSLPSSNTPALPLPVLSAVHCSTPGHLNVAGCCMLTERCAQLQRYADAITGRSPVVFRPASATPPQFHPGPFDSESGVHHHHHSSNACSAASGSAMASAGVQALPMLCCNKFGSNVVEKLLRYAAGAPALVTLVSAMVLTPHRPLEILFDGFGNYVIQAAIHMLSTVVSSGAHLFQSSSESLLQRECHELLLKLLDCLLPAMPTVSQQNYGKRVEGAVADGVLALMIAASHQQHDEAAALRRTPDAPMGTLAAAPPSAAVHHGQQRYPHGIGLLLPQHWMPLPPVIHSLVAQKQATALLMEGNVAGGFM